MFNAQVVVQAEREAQKIVQKGRTILLFFFIVFLELILYLARECKNVAAATPSPKVLTYSPDRTKRVKDARSEAQKEIEDYRKQKEEEFKAFEKEVGHETRLLRVFHIPYGHIALKRKSKGRR